MIQCEYGSIVEQGWYLSWLFHRTVSNSYCMEDCTRGVTLILYCYVHPNETHLFSIYIIMKYQYQ